MPIGSDKGNFIKPGFDPLAAQTSVNASDLYSWGRNHKGQLGLSDTVDRSSPVQVGSLTTWGTLPKMTGSKFCVTFSTTTT